MKGSRHVDRPDLCRKENWLARWNSRALGESRWRALKTLNGERTYPRTYPTIDITAEDRVYLSLAVNQDSVSGNISMNHS